MKTVLRFLIFCFPLAAMATSNFYLSYYSSFHISRDTNNQFNKYWNFFKIFSSKCTIQFSRYRDGWLDLYFSFLVYCTLGSSNADDSLCVLLHTFSEHQESAFHYKLNNVTAMSSEMFSTKRNSGFCVVQIVSKPAQNLDLIQKSNSPFYNSPENYPWKNEKLKFYAPDYIFLSSYFEDVENIDKPAYINLAYFLSSKVIVFLYSRYKVYANCIFCNPDQAKEYFINKQNTYFPRKVRLLTIATTNLNVNLSLAALQQTFEKMNFKKPLNGKLEFKRKFPTRNCYYEAYFTNLLHLMDSADFEFCIKEIILCSINCSQYTFLRLALKNFVITEKFGDLKIYTALQYGSHSYGLKYSIFVRQPETSMNSKHIMSLVAPFDTIGWIIILGSTAVMNVILKLSGFKEGMFWIFSTLIEQGENGRLFLSKHNVMLTLGWLYTAILLRLAYTSSLYSYMTKDPVPKDIPSAFDDLLFNFKMNLIFENSALTYLTYYYLLNEDVFDESNSPKRYDEDPRFMEMNHRTWTVSNLNDIVSASFEAKFNCRRQKVIKKKFAAILHNTTDKCMDGERFAYLYGSELFITKFQMKLSLVKAYMMMLERHIIFENEEIPLFTTQTFWISTRKSYFEKRFVQTLSCVVESGIYSLQLRYAKINSYRLFEEIDGAEIWKTKNRSVIISSLSAMVNVWMEFDCFFHYKEVCTRGYSKKSYSKVKVQDLESIWILLAVLCLNCILVLTLEILAFYLSEQKPIAKYSPSISFVGDKND